MDISTEVIFPKLNNRIVPEVLCLNSRYSCETVGMISI